MSTHTTAPSTVASRDASAVAPAPARWTGAMRLAAGAVLVAGPVLWGAGMFFSPQAEDRKSTRLNSSHVKRYRMPSSA